jgi:hypothetical protein
VRRMFGRSLEEMPPAVLPMTWPFEQEQERRDRDGFVALLLASNAVVRTIPLRAWRLRIAGLLRPLRRE